ncbi:MAG: deoxycytidine deaminase [Coleofasciculus sp. B1-GNL1-01]|uniref:dCTP deaminase domain-containing protein n=1 Tax=Coleofasciculus sp. B1-GNL1-01 TaxID=3068484 RepID=UPI0032F97FD0
MLSDVDIEKQIESKKIHPDTGIAIEPFEKKYLTPVGYDLRVGQRGFSWNNKLEVEIERNGRIEIAPRDTVVIETLESISLSREVGATIHAMATRVTSQGLSHISTTVDPGWTGKLLISCHNYRDSPVELRFGDSLCTICFFRVESQAKGSVGRPPDRDDIWQQLREKANQEKQRQAQETQYEKDRERRERQTRLFWMASFAVVALAIGIFTSLINPVIGASLAAVIGGISPFVVEILKAK